MNRMIICALAMVMTFSGWSQEAISWKNLSGVDYAYSFSDEKNTFIGIPTFSEEVLALDGKEISIQGYVLTLDLHGEMIVLSENPFNSCFFCTGVGQESVIEIRLKKRNRNLKQDEIVRFSGILKLNRKEFELTYVLEEAWPTK